MSSPSLPSFSNSNSSNSNSSSSIAPSSSCGSGKVKGTYNTPLHVAALVIILVLSTLACAFPILARRLPPSFPVPHRFLFLSRHFGTGVLIATAFVHLLPTAFVSLTHPCLPRFWNEVYSSMAGFIAMMAMFAIVGIEMFFAMRGAGHLHHADTHDMFQGSGGEDGTVQHGHEHGHDHDYHHHYKTNDHENGYAGGGGGGGGGDGVSCNGTASSDARHKRRELGDGNNDDDNRLGQQLASVTSTLRSDTAEWASSTGGSHGEAGSGGGTSGSSRRGSREPLIKYAPAVTQHYSSQSALGAEEQPVWGGSKDDEHDNSEHTSAAAAAAQEPSVGLSDDDDDGDDDASDGGSADATATRGLLSDVRRGSDNLDLVSRPSRRRHRHHSPRHHDHRHPPHLHNDHPHLSSVAWADVSASQKSRQSRSSSSRLSKNSQHRQKPRLHPSHHDQQHDEQVDRHEEKRLLLQCLLLEAGILFHSVFIGLALSVTTGTSFIVLLIAITFHQAFEGLALGARIAAIPSLRPSSPRPWLMALAYGATTPLGQAIGLAVHNLYDPRSQTGLLMVGITNAVSSGLLLFAGLVELLAEDFLSAQSYETLRGRSRVEACAAVIGGALLMALVGVWA